MYSTCLFCSGKLGRNEAIENFTVGRRLAYDAAKGRLWVICRRCARWNLTPLETRWEAIEEAERAYRATRLRVSTDNIGLAQLREGLELVRIGAPPKLELAGWRYGDQFGKRRRKYHALMIAGGIAGSAQGIVQLSAFAGIAASGGALLAAGVVLSLGHAVWQVRNQRRDKRVAKIAVPLPESLYRLTLEDARNTRITPTGPLGAWELTLPHKKLVTAGYHPDVQPSAELSRVSRDAVLSGDAAIRAMAQILPHLNPAGASKRGIMSALKVIESTESIDDLVWRASVDGGYPNHNSPRTTRHGGNTIAGLAPELRLAMELVLHEDDERRAMEGELRTLEERWREAEEIASIADSLFYPPELERKLREMKE